MSENEPITSGQLMQWSDAEREEAEAVKKKIDEQFTIIREHGRILETTFVELAQTLKQVRDKRLWALWDYNSWGSYISSLQHQVARSTLFQYISVIEALSGQVSEADLTQMGIKKALELKRVLSAKPDALLTDKVKEAALDPEKSVADVRQMVFEEHNVTPDYPGKWFDLEGVYLTAEEKTIFTRAFNVAMRVDPPISKAMPACMIRKEIYLRLCMEFLATYEAAVQGG